MFFILPVGVDYRAQRYPVVTFTLIGLNLVVYAITLLVRLQTGTPGHELSAFEQALWLVPAESTWYTYLTTLFVHAGLFHVLGNMVYLFLFGSPVEDVLGRWPFLVFYLVGGLASGFAHIAFTPGHFSSVIPLGGASGAVSACMGGFVLLFARTRIEFKYLLFLFVRLFTGGFFLPAWLVMSFWFGKDLSLAVLDLLDESEGGGVAFGAHAGGFACGLVCILLWKLLARRTDRDTVEESEPALATVAGSDEGVVYLYDAGAQHGPFTLTQVRQMRALGSLTPEACYWHEGLPEWRRVEELDAGT